MFEVGYWTNKLSALGKAVVTKAEYEINTESGVGKE